MSKRAFSKPGFTLLELLLASVLFIIISGLATASLVSALHTQQTRLNSQNVAQQLQAAGKEIQQDFQYASASQVIELTGTNGSTGWNNSSYPNDELLILLVPPRDARGAVIANPSSQELHLYCSELQYSAGKVIGKRLARYVVTGQTVLPTVQANTPSPLCVAAGISGLQALLSLSSLTPQYLTDANTQVGIARFWPVWYGISGISPSTPANQNMPALRVELTGQWVANNSSSSAIESRANVSSTSSLPILYQRTFTSGKYGNAAYYSYTQ